MSKESSVSVPIRCHYDELMPIDTAMAMLDKKNPNKHTEDDIKDMAKTLSLVGWEHPIVIVNKTVHYGNKRTRAAKYAGFKQVPVVYRTYENKDLETITKIADNASGQRSELDLNIVNELTLDLGPDIELDVLGIKDFEPLPEDKYANKSDEESDHVPETKENELGVKTGDIWILGNHRLLCGDATKKEDVERLMDGQKADMVYTDPPYGMGAVENSGVLKNKYNPIKGDHNPDLAKVAFQVWQTDISGIWWGANYYSSVLPDASKWLVWDKNNGGSDQTDCELAWTNIKGSVRQFTQASEKVNREHPTQKPVVLHQWAFGFVEAEIVADPFLGSGSTLIACEKNNRRCFGMEIDPH